MRLFIGGVPGGSGAMWHLIPPSFSPPPGRTPPAPSCSQPCRSCCAWRGGPRGGCPCWTQWGHCSCGTPLPWRRPPAPGAWGQPWGGFAVCTAPAFLSWYGGGGGGPLWSSFVGSFWCRLGILRVVWGHWESLWGHLGLSFGILRCHLGIVWGLFCAIWGLIWVTLGPLGQFWDHLGHLGAVWGNHLGLFLCNLFHFGAIWVPSGSLVPVVSILGPCSLFFWHLLHLGLSPPAVLAVRCPAPPAGTGGAAPVRTVGPLPAAAARVPPAPRRECPQRPPRVHTASPCCVRHASLWVDLMALYAHRVAWVDLVAPRAQRG